jgi:hypothetical protein
MKEKDTPSDSVKPTGQQAFIRHYDDNRITVFCPLGHVIDSREFSAGSSFASELSRHSGDRFDRLAQSCQGFGH